MRKALVRAWMAARARPLLASLAEIEKSQWLSADEVAGLQNRKLRETLAHAAGSVPYYRDLFRKEGFDPMSVRSVTDLRRLPPLGRETLTARFDDLLADPAPPGRFIRSTGGSTGRPLRFAVDPHEMITRSAHIYRGLGWLGWHPGDKVAYVWGSDIDTREHKGTLGRLRDTFMRVLWLDAFTLSEELLDQYLDRLRVFEPKVLIGYPSSLHLLAQRAMETSVRPRIGGIECSAEMLTPRVREDLRAAFGCPVLDRYGCRETGVVAHECPEGALHINAESVVVESLEGELLLTTLNNRSMPLIRYHNEDLGLLSERRCPCGRGLPLMDKLQGRMSDIIRTPGGRLIHGEFFTHLFYGVRDVSRFQVKQTRRDHLEIRVVAGERFMLADQKELERAIVAHADQAFGVTWMRVDEIPSGQSGKYRFIIAAPPDAADED